MEDSWEKLAGDAVEKEVAASARAMHKCLKTFTQRGLTACAANCEAMQTDIAEFQRVVPLVVVGQILILSAADACFNYAALCLWWSPCSSARGCVRGSQHYLL